MPAPTPKAKKTGSVWYVKDESGKPARRWPSGRVRYRGKVTWPDGKREDIGVPEAHCKDEKHADEYVAHAQEQLTKNGTMLLAKAMPPPVDPNLAAAWFDAWIAERKRRGLTSAHDNEAHYKEHIRPVVATHIRDWTPDDMRALSRALDAKVQAGAMKWKTAGNVWGTAHGMCRDACKSKHDEIRVRGDNPIANVAGPERGEKTSKQYLYPSEFLAFVSCRDVPLEWRRIVALAIYLFPRAGELRSLQWEDVDVERGVVHVHRARGREDKEDKSTKTKAARRFAIEPAILPVLRAMHAERGDRTHVIDVPADNNLARDFRLWLVEAGVERAELHKPTPTRKALTFHDLRASGLTWMAVRGDDPLKIMQRAGHADFTTTQGYIREAEAVRDGFGEVFPPLPDCLRAVSTSPVSSGNNSGEGGIRNWRDSGHTTIAVDIRTSDPPATDRIDDASTRNTAKPRGVDADVDAPDDARWCRVEALATAVQALLVARLTTQAAPLVDDLVSLARARVGPRAEVVTLADRRAERDGQ